jgi:hypothetical protein
LSLYQFASNTPIQAIDLDGLEAQLAPTETVVEPVIKPQLQVVWRNPNSPNQISTEPIKPKSNISVTGAALKLLGRSLSFTLTLVFEPSQLGTGDIVIPPPSYLFDSPTPSPSPSSPSAEAPVFKTDDDRSARKKGGIFYATYTKQKINPDGSISVYSGRTSGWYSGYEPTEQEVKAAVDRRENGHTILRDEGYSPAVVDKSSKNKSAIRGREQQLIDYHGGSQSDGGKSRNKIRSVKRTNPNIEIYDNAATMEFKGKLPNNNPADKKSNPK